MLSANFKKLMNTVLEASESSLWENAVDEWDIFDCEEDPKAETFCVCGQFGLRYLFTIRNRYNGMFIYPIGSTCIKKFGRDDLCDQTDVAEGMFKLLHAVEENRFLTLSTDFFSRKLLYALYDEGAFEPNRFNNYNAEEDLEFLLSMFNKKDKNSITQNQQRKIRAIIAYSIRPFLRQRLSDKIKRKH